MRLFQVSMGDRGKKSLAWITRLMTPQTTAVLIGNELSDAIKIVIKLRRGSSEGRSRYTSIGPID